MGEPHFLRASGQVYMYFQIVTNLGIQSVCVQANSFFFGFRAGPNFLSSRPSSVADPPLKGIHILNNI